MIAIGESDPQKSRSSSTEPVASSKTAEAATPDELLPHWGGVRRAIHRWCRRSRRFNTLVAAIEMRLGREELLSLPQYMALCPTGQCNASCEFCSVTIHRTGIIKRELPFDRLQTFLNPVRRTVRMYGIEGNGEPTLYDRFDELVDALTQGGATFYLITNAARLGPDRIKHLVERGVDSVNVSLNAASAETHRQVMKFKYWDDVVTNIRRLVEARDADRTRVSVSIVVDHENIHEVVEFLQLADELGVDRVHVRPLSEIATDAGPVEDLRDLVPYEAEVRDCVERVEEFLADSPPRAELNFEPGNFRAHRQDPADRQLKPRGYEDRWLAPRRSGWSVADGVGCTWRGEGCRLEAAAGASSRPLIECLAVPIDGTREERFVFRARVQTGQLTARLVDLAGHTVAEHVLEASEEQDGGPAVSEHRVGIAIDPKWGDALRVRFDASEGAVLAELDFERLWNPVTKPGDKLRLPAPRQWEAPTPEASVKWQGDRVHIDYEGREGPYLLKSFSVPCRTNETVKLPVAAHVKEGRLGLGILDRSAQSWARTFEFEPGRHEEMLEIETEQNDRLQFVLYSTTPGQLSAEVDFIERSVSKAGAPSIDDQLASDASPTANGVRTPPDPILVSPEPDGSSESVRKPRWRDRLRRLLFGRPRFACQKPWTDLNNFSVDGRMDVCCIATGASQARYQLGNLFQQEFQEVWNGERAREFRRTVNTSEALPPCQRCPLVYAYQGPLFSPETTWSRVRHLMRPNLPWRPVRAVFIVAGLTLYAPIHWLIFRGFRR